jgi:hypothetical protein
MTTADLAATSRRTLILAALDEPAVHQQAAELARAALIQPDAASLAAFGTDPLDSPDAGSHDRASARQSRSSPYGQQWNAQRAGSANSRHVESPTAVAGSQC